MDDLELADVVLTTVAHHGSGVKKRTRNLLCTTDEMENDLAMAKRKRIRVEVFDSQSRNYLTFPTHVCRRCRPSSLRTHNRTWRCVF